MSKLLACLILFYFSHALGASNVGRMLPEKETVKINSEVTYGNQCISQSSCSKLEKNSTNFQSFANEECCRICKKGKACGNSCISRWKECHKPPGCACNE